MFDFLEIIDLSYNMKNGMLTYNAPWHPSFSIKQLAQIKVEGRETRKVSFGTHTGTHIDAPRHFIEQGNTVEKIPLEKLIGKVTIIDFSNLKEKECVTAEMLKSLNISEKIIFKFGWGKYYGSDKFYVNYPYFSKEAANYLVSKGVEMLGHDTPSPDASYKKNNQEDSPIHKILLANDVVLVEYIANLEQVKNYEGWNILVCPLKIDGADGSPARVLIYK